MKKQNRQVAGSSRGSAAKRPRNQSSVVAGGRKTAQAQAATPHGRVGVAALLSKKPFADGWAEGMLIPLPAVEANLELLDNELRNLYAPSHFRAYWRGMQKALAERVDADVPSQAETNKKPTIVTTMKKHIESATSAFGLLLTAIVAILVDVAGSISTAAPAKAGGKDKEEPESNDEDLLGGGEPEPEPEISLDDLKAAGQAAIKAGKADKMKAVLKKHGAENLGGLSKGGYPAVLAALKKLA